MKLKGYSRVEVDDFSKSNGNSFSFFQNDKILKTLFAFIIGMIANNGIQAQVNLVPNASFENVNYFPCFFWGSNSTIEFASSWNATQTLQFVCTPDLFCIDTCENEQYIPDNPFGNQIPESGNSYVGLVLFANFSDDVFGIESIYTKLDSILLPENNYELCAYFSLSENCCLNSRKLSFAVTPDTLTESLFNSLNPNDIFYLEGLEQCNYSDWTQICTTFSPTQPGNILTFNVINNQAALLSDTVLYDNGICEHPAEVISVYYYIDDVSLVNKGKNTGVPQNGSKNSLAVYPNPSNGQFLIKLTNEIVGLNLSVVDVTGRNVFQFNFQGTLQERSINLSYLSNGVYYLNCSSNGQYIGSSPIVIFK